MIVARLSGFIFALVFVLQADRLFAQPETQQLSNLVMAAEDILERVDLDDKFAQDVIRRAGQVDTVEALKSRLDEIALVVHQHSDRFTSTELQMLSLLRLESLSRHWSFLHQQILGWRRAYDRASNPYLEDVADLARRQMVWAATLASPEVQNGPAVLRERIGLLIEQLTHAQQAISGPLEKYLLLGRQATAIEVIVDAGLQQTSGAIRYNDQRLMAIDSPPLWRLERGQSRDEVVSMDDAIAIETDFAKDYAQANQTALRSYHLLELSLLPLFIWLKIRSSNKESDDPNAKAAARVLQRPISTWLLIILCGVMLVQSEAPILVHQIVLFLVLVPVLRLLPPGVYVTLGYWPYVISSLYLLSLVGFVVGADPIYHRWYLLIFTVLTSILLGFFVMRRVSSGDQLSRISTHFMQVMGWIAIALLLVAIMANIVGNATLAEMLVTGLVLSAYVGLVLYAGVYVVTSLLYLMMKRANAQGNRASLRYGSTVLHGLTRLLKLVAFISWAVVTFDQLRILSFIQDVLHDVLISPLKFGQLAITLGGALLFCFSVWLALWTAKAVRLILSEEILPKVSLPRGVAHSVSTLTYYVLIIAGLMVALVAVGFDVSQMTIVLGALGVGVGLGLQSVVNNFVSGLILMFERPIQLGDVVEIAGTTGWVREIGMRATTVTTFDGADVVVPNGTLLSDKLINWTLNDMSRRIEVNVSVAYGSDPRRVLEVLLEAARSTQDVAVQPEPVAVFSAFGDSALEFSVRAWTNHFAQWMQIRSNLTLNIHDALIAAGFEIPFPQQDLHVRTIAPDVVAVLNTRQP